MPVWAPRGPAWLLAALCGTGNVAEHNPTSCQNNDAEIADVKARSALRKAEEATSVSEKTDGKASTTLWTCPPVPASKALVPRMSAGSTTSSVTVCDGRNRSSMVSSKGSSSPSKSSRRPHRRHRRTGSCLSKASSQASSQSSVSTKVSNPRHQPLPSRLKLNVSEAKDTATVLASQRAHFETPAKPDDGRHKASKALEQHDKAWWAATELTWPASTPISLSPSTPSATCGGDQALLQNTNPLAFADRIALGGRPGTENGKRLHILDPKKYKTEYCNNWKERGACRLQGSCQFAHGESELVERQKHPKYKTKLCRWYHGPEGWCKYGSRCQFVHDELQAPPSPKSANKRTDAGPDKPLGNIRQARLPLPTDGKWGRPYMPSEPMYSRIGLGQRHPKETKGSSHSSGETSLGTAVTSLEAKQLGAARLAWPASATSPDSSSIWNAPPSQSPLSTSLSLSSMLSLSETATFSQASDDVLALHRRFAAMHVTSSAQAKSSITSTSKSSLPSSWHCNAM